MSFEPENITKDHILRAIDKIEREKLELIPSMKFDVIINGKAYPPKEVMRFAHQEMNGEFIWIPGGGTTTNKYLEKFGFEIKSKYDSMKINDYLQSLSKFLDSKPANYSLNGFFFEGVDTETQIGSIGGGGWKDTKGFRIKIPQLNDIFILRLTDRYVVFESIRRNSQLVNYQLKENRNYISDSDSVIIKESYRLTLRSPVSAHKVKEALAESGFDKDGIISRFEIDEMSPEEEIKKWINWAIFREKAKEVLRRQSFEVVEDESDYTHIIGDQPKNMIFYGPPGTGKTYSTLAYAVTIVEQRSLAEVEMYSRETLKSKFSQYQSEGKIEFTTFHQSLSYEDFIEGIKPLTQEGEVVYEIQEGIFKRLCRKATQKSVTTTNFQKAYDSLLQEIKANNGLLVLESLVHAREFTIYENSRGNLRFHANTEKAYEGTIKKDIIEHYLKTGEVLDWPSYTKAIAKHLETKHNYSQKEIFKPANHVLIIDEINRGNISQIFGELITLLEDDKRTGENEALEVTLPYSKEKFSVPPNLYLIGTMNTADRSVEALDTALRRRFSFVEMPPRHELLSPERMYWQLLWDYSHGPWDDPEFIGKEYALFDLLGAGETLRQEDPKYQLWDRMIKEGKHENQIAYLNGLFNGPLHLQKLLETINRRIEKLLDKDHQIGHAYFLGIEAFDRPIHQLRIIFQNKIIPLLQEYFYGNYGKMQLVVGKDFVFKADNQQESADTFFAASDYDGKDDAVEREVYHVTNWLALMEDGSLKYSDELFRSAVIRIYNPKWNG